MADFSKSPLRPCVWCFFSLVGDSVLFPRCRLCHTHKGSGVLPLCCWNPVYPDECGEVFEVCWGRVVDIDACLLEDALEFM